MAAGRGVSPDHAMHHLELGNSLKKAWSVSIGDGGGEGKINFAQPVSHNGVIYSMDVDYLIKAHNAGTGRKIWQTQLPVPKRDEEAFGGGLAFHDGNLFVTTGFAQILSLSAQDGAVGWQQPMPAPVRGAPTVIDDRVLAITIDNQALAFDTQTGEEMWAHSGMEEIAGLIGGGKAAAVSGTFIIPYSSGQLIALSSSNGQVGWSENLAALKRVNSLAGLVDIRAKPVIDRGIIYALSHSGRMVSVELRGGARLWDRKIGGKETPWIAGDFLFIMANDGNLIGLTRQSGRVRWLTTLPSWKNPASQEGRISWVGPILAGDRLILANNLGELLSVSPYTGELLGKLTLDGPIYIPPLVVNRTLFVLSARGNLTAFR